MLFKQYEAVASDAALPRDGSLLSLPTEWAGQVKWVAVGFVSRRATRRDQTTTLPDDLGALLT